MNSETRAALVEEISAILQGCVIVANMDDDAPPTTISEGTLNNMAYSLLPKPSRAEWRAHFIERLLAERNTDALLSDAALVETIRRELLIAYRWGLTTAISTALSTPEQVVDSGTTQIMAAVAKAKGKGVGTE